MAKRNFGIGVLAIVLVFGMAVIGCDNLEEDEFDTNPLTPTSFEGTIVSPNNSIQLTWASADSVEIDFRRASAATFPIVNRRNLTGVTSYILTGLDFETEYEFRIRANRAGRVSDFSPIISVTTGRPLTGSVYISSLVTQRQIFLGNHVHQVAIFLALSGGGMVE